VRRVACGVQEQLETAIGQGGVRKEESEALQEELARAVAAEDFEEAAALHGRLLGTEGRGAGGACGAWGACAIPEQCDSGAVRFRSSAIPEQERRLPWAWTSAGLWCCTRGLVLGATIGGGSSSRIALVAACQCLPPLFGTFSSFPFPPSTPSPQPPLPLVPRWCKRRCVRNPAALERSRMISTLEQKLVEYGANVCVSPDPAPEDVTASNQFYYLGNLQINL